MRTTYEKITHGQQFIRESCGQRFIAIRNGAVVLEGAYVGDVYTIRQDEIVLTDTDTVMQAIEQLTRTHESERDDLKDKVRIRIAELLGIFNARRIEGGPTWLRSSVVEGTHFLTQLKTTKANEIWWQCSQMEEEACKTYPEVADIVKLVQTCEAIGISIGNVKATFPTEFS